MSFVDKHLLELYIIIHSITYYTIPQVVIFQDCVKESYLIFILLQ